MIQQPKEEPKLSTADLGKALYHGGISKLAMDGRALIHRGRRTIVVTSLEAPNTMWSIRLEEL